MKRLGGVHSRLIGPDNLWAAWNAFRRGKNRRPSVREFAARAEQHITKLHQQLQSGDYTPGSHRRFVIAEPKRRLISCAPIRDRVVHHALHRVLAPTLDRGLVDHCYACLPGRGVQRAALAFQGAMRRYRYVLLLDVRMFFPSIDPDIVLAILERRVKDRPCLDLCETILEGGRGLYDDPRLRAFLGMGPDWPRQNAGLPIGNLTSQFFGNHYLSGLDHALRRELRLPYSQRYMDDIAMFSDDRHRLCEARSCVAEWLLSERKQQLKHPNKEPRPTKKPIIYLGRRIGRQQIEPTAAALRRMRQRVGCALLDPDEDKIERTLASYRGSLGLGPWNTEVSADLTDSSAT
ncbi:MAG: RNA-directed DNA polymerase [bacterium]|nr:RNA-directed DNA polymerase [bacterium]